MTYQKFFSHREHCERSTDDKILILICCSRLLRCILSTLFDSQDTVAQTLSIYKG